jgi:hypothetical protein
MAATEINNSRACALTIRTRGGFNGMLVYLTFIGGHYGYITRIVLLQHCCKHYLTCLSPAVHAVVARRLAAVHNICVHLDGSP